MERCSQIGWWGPQQRSCRAHGSAPLRCTALRHRDTACAASHGAHRGLTTYRSWVQSVDGAIAKSMGQRIGRLVRRFFQARCRREPRFRSAAECPDSKQPRDAAATAPGFCAPLHQLKSSKIPPQSVVRGFCRYRNSHAACGPGSAAGPAGISQRAPRSRHRQTRFRKFGPTH